MPSPAAVDSSDALAFVPEMANAIKRISRAWAQVRKGQVAWDFVAIGKAMATFVAERDQADARWQERQPQLAEALRALQDYTRSPEWVTEAEAALREAGVPLQATAEREYEFPPFKLVLNVQEGYARLALGRKSERTTALAPRELAAWVALRYERVVRSRFDAETFKKELLAAYQIANRAKYGGKVQWGNSVELSMIYDLLTLRQAARQEYPRQLFLFDLARLREEPDVQFGGQRFEFGFARGQDKVFAVVDRQGREARLGSLIVYEAAEPRA